MRLFRAQLLLVVVVVASLLPLSRALAASISGGVREQTPGTGPIAGATVRLEQGGQIKYTTVTNGTGNYSFASVTAGDYNLVALKACYQNNTRPKTITGTMSQNIVMEWYPRLSGTVTDNVSGSPISGATVRLEKSGTIIQQTTTNGSGSYSFSCIVQDSYSLVVLKLGEYVNASQSIGLTALSTAYSQGIAMTPKATIAGLVYDRVTGAAIGGATVRLEKSGVIKYETIADGNGIYSMTDLIPDTYSLVALKIGDYLNSSEGRILAAGQHATGANISMIPSTARIAGGVRNELTGAPISGATVRLERSGQSPYTTISNGTGNYSFVGIPPANYTLVGLKLGEYVNWSQDRPLVAGDNFTDANIAMTPSATIAGVVTDKWTGATLDGATVRLEQSGVVKYTFQSTDADGAYLLSGVVPGTYSCVALKLGTYQNTSSNVTLSSGQYLGGHSISMCPLTARIRGGVRNTLTDVAISGATVRLEQSGQILFTTVSNGTGNYSFVDVPSGDYSLVGLKLGEYDNWSQGKTLSACDNDTTANIAMNPKTTISGIVKGSDTGLALSGAAVRLEQAGVVKYSFQYTGSDGAYVISGVTSGTYNLVGLKLDQYQNWSSQRTLVAGQNLTNQDITMTPLPASLRGSVVDGTTGQAVAAASVELHLGAATVASVLSGLDGSYDFGSVATGSYTLVAFKAGVYPSVTIPLPIHGGDAIVQAITLAMPAGPYNLRAVTNQTTNAVTLSWQCDIAGVTEFELQSKVSLASDGTFAVIASPAEDAREAADSPNDGLAHEYRIRALVAAGASTARTTTAVSSVRTLWSNRCVGSPLSGWTTPPAPSKVVAKNFGDGATMHVLVSPPGTTSWAGAAGVILNVYDDAGHSHLLQSVPVAPSIASGPLTFTYLGSRSTRYWFGSRIQGASGVVGPEAFSDASGVKPDWPPVLFVHGIWAHKNDWDTWDAWFSADGIARRDAVEFACPGETWEGWSHELFDKVEAYLAPGGRWPFDERVDLVTHSQGGLAARSYIEELGGSKRVRSLVMVGTPNHGGDHATLSNWMRKLKISLPSPCTIGGHNQGADFLQTNSKRLKQLNFGRENLTDDVCGDSPDELAATRKGLTDYFLFAGTGGDMKRLERKVYGARTRDKCSGDGIVRWPSVRLRSLGHGVGSCQQWFDSDITTTPLVHMWMFTLGANGLLLEELKSRPLAEYIAQQVLRPGTAPRPATLCSGVAPLAIESDPGGGALATFGKGVREIAEATEDSESLDLAVTYTDSVFEGASRTNTIQVDTCSTLTVLVSGSNLHPSIELISPTGDRYTPADTASDPELTYEEDDSLGYAAFGVQAPHPGPWTVQVNGFPGEGEQVYTESWVVEGAPYRLLYSTSALQYQPGEAMLVNASLTRTGVPYAARITAEIGPPAGSPIRVQLNDLGTDGDSLSGDGTYSGKYEIPNLDGQFSVHFDASRELGDGLTVSRAADTSFSVSVRPDLEARSFELRASPEVPAVGESAMVLLTVRNIAVAQCDSFEVVLRDISTGDSLGTAGGHLAAQDSVAITVPWIPSVRGEHQLLATIRSLVPAEAQTDNNEISSLVAVSGPLPPIVDVDPAAVPSGRFALGPPIPNPSRAGLRLAFAVPRAARVSLVVFDVRGRVVAVLADEVFPPGLYSREWNRQNQAGAHVAPGVYFARLTAPHFASTRKLVLLR